MGRSGDEPVTLPVIASLDLLDQVSPEERFAATEFGRLLIEGMQQRHRTVIAVAHQRTVSSQSYDPTDSSPLVALSQIAGG
jgi:hypothetical protein